MVVMVDTADVVEAGDAAGSIGAIGRQFPRLTE